MFTFVNLIEIVVGVRQLWFGVHSHFPDEHCVLTRGNGSEALYFRSSSGEWKRLGDIRDHIIIAGHLD